MVLTLLLYPHSSHSYSAIHSGAPTNCKDAKSVPDGALKVPSQTTSESSIAKISEEEVNIESRKEMVVDGKERGQPTGRAVHQGPKLGKYRGQQACVCR